MQQAIDEAVAAYERDRFWEQFTERYEALASDAAAFAEIKCRAGGRGTIADRRPGW